MALSSLRLRQTLALSSSLIRNLNSFSTISSPPTILQSQTSLSPSILPPIPRNVQWFRSTSLASYSSRSSPFRNDDEPMPPDTILFEGCDYNHWLITIDFRDVDRFKDIQATPEQMVEHYVQTAAQVFGSVEEAKKRIYACSTTTYNGFQVECSEETSEKFKGLPGVVFILPDSYIDPVNKEYGGDKYIEGQIIHRPPPIQQGRNRYNDSNRNYGRPRSDRQRDPMPMHPSGQTNPPPQNYSQQQNYPPCQSYSPEGPPQNYPPEGPQQNYPPQGSPQSYPPQGPPQNYSSQGTQPGYSPQVPQNYPPQSQQQNYPPRSNYGSSGQRHMPMGNSDYAPEGRDPRSYGPDNRAMRGDNRNFGPSPGGEHRQGAGSSYGQSFPVEQRDGMQGEQRDYKAIGQDGQWPGSYCDTKQSCCYPTTGKPDSDFSIHGLWPNYKDGSYPSNCDPDSPFDSSTISDLESRMQADWPTLGCPSGNGMKFWAHEWEKHGTCSESVLDQHAYFENTLNLKKQIDLLNVLKNAGIEPNGRFYSASSISGAIKKATGFTPGIECNVDTSGNSQLYQIYVCVDTSGSNFIQCPVLPRGRCSSSIEFPEF